MYEFIENYNSNFKAFQQIEKVLHCKKRMINMFLIDFRNFHICEICIYSYVTAMIRFHLL